jgi:DNA-binding HxlR family transcriptional regulator
MSVMNRSDKQMDCGIAKALEVIGGKWTLLIVRDLIEQPRRFGELEQSLAGISPRTLTIRLKELEADGVLRRDCSAGEFHPLYRLTDKGSSLHILLDQLRRWGDDKA